MNFYCVINLTTLVLVGLSTEIILSLPTSEDSVVGYRERQVEEFLKLIANQHEHHRDNSNSTRYDHCTGESSDCPQGEICCCMEFIGVNYGCTCLYQFLLSAFPLATCDLPSDEDDIAWGWRQNSEQNYNNDSS